MTISFLHSVCRPGKIEWMWSYFLELARVFSMRIGTNGNRGCGSLETLRRTRAVIIKTGNLYI